MGRSAAGAPRTMRSPRSGRLEARKVAAPHQQPRGTMPIKSPPDLPARETLEHEGVLIIRDTDAIRQDIRPMRIALLNLMPKKIETETQIARVLAGTPQIGRAHV